MTTFQDVDNLRSTLVVYQFSDQDSDQEVWCEATNLAGTTSSNKVRYSQTKGDSVTV